MQTRAAQVELIAEVNLSARHRNAISLLLNDCFPDYPGDQLFYPQPPHFRLLTWAGEQLSGHMAGIIRAIRVAGRPITIFGIADLCTDPAWTGQRIGSLLLNRMEELATLQGISYVMAMAVDEEFYLKSGYQIIDVRCTWLAYLQGRSLGLFQRTPPSGLMVKCLGQQAWPEGDVDLLGPLF
jgi:GNAT superfamily N-acetyltransferase